jgi:hypothetical protein
MIDTISDDIRTTDTIPYHFKNRQAYLSYEYDARVRIDGSIYKSYINTN